MKRVLSILLVTLLAFSAMSIIAVNATGEPTFTLSDASGKVGDEVTVNLNIANNPGITALELRVSYSAKDLKLKSVSNGTTFVDGDWNFNELNATGLTKNPFTIYFDNDVEDSKANGLVAVMTFEILEGAETSTITATQETVYNTADDEVEFSYVPATVTVTAAEPTDQEKFEAAVAASITPDAADPFGTTTAFKGLEMLGVQEKTDATDVRFITAVSKDVINDACVTDYGYIFAKSSKQVTPDKIANLTVANAKNKFSCYGSDNTAAGDFGDPTADPAYKYVTCGVNGIAPGYDIVGRFYVETSYGTTYYYAMYGNANGVVYSIA